MNPPIQRAAKRFLAAFLAVLLPLAGESQAAWMKTANYTNPVTRQQHFDLGLSYIGTVVHLMWGTTFVGSAVVVNNPRCILMAAHEFENGPGGTFQDPATDSFFIRTGPNYLNNPGSSVRISQIIRHPTRTAPGVGKDVVIAILESDLPGATPTTIAPAQPAVAEVLDIVGFGNQGTASVSSWGYIVPTSGDIIGGKAPVFAIDSATIQTKFLANSAQPLIFNSTPGDSGGGLFNSQRQLCGTISNSTTPTATASTFSVNLIAISAWIQQVTTPYDPPIAPTLQMQLNAGQMTLTAVGTPVSQNGGHWILQRSGTLGTWTDVEEPFIGNVCVTPVTGPSEFYRLRWSAD